MVFSSNSLNGLRQSSIPATSPSMHQAPIATLFPPFSSWDFSPPHQGLHFTLTHLWRALCWSPFFSSPHLLLSLLPSSLVLGTRSSNKTEHGACSLMISSPGNWAKHKNRHKRSKSHSRHLQLHSGVAAAQTSCCSSAVVPPLPNEGFQYQRHSQLSK